MEYVEYREAEAFLDVVQARLEQKEAVYGLMLGISLRLVEDAMRYGSQPLFATVFDRDVLQLAVLMTPPHKLQIASLGDRSSEAVALLASEVRRGSWPVPAVIAEEGTARHFGAEWCVLTGDGSRTGMRQRIYELRRVSYRDYPRGHLRQATVEDAPCIAQWRKGFAIDCFGDEAAEEDIDAARTVIESGDLYVWVDPDPVSMAGYARPTRRGVSISYVYTPPEHRDQGYASAVVASISELALLGGREFCTLYTDLANPVSNSIYRRIGYKPVADVMDIHFAAPDQTNR